MCAMCLEEKYLKSAMGKKIIIEVIVYLFQAIFLQDSFLFSYVFLSVIFSCLFSKLKFSLF